MIKIPLKAGHHWPSLNGVSLASRWWPNIVALRFFRESGPVLLRKPFFDLSGGPYPLSSPLWIRPCQSRNFQPCRDVSWVEPVLNRVKCVWIRKQYGASRDSNQRPLHLKSSTLPLVDSTDIIQLFGRCIATWYVTVSFRERSGSVVECLTRDRRAAGSSLTGVTALCP